MSYIIKIYSDIDNSEIIIDTAHKLRNSNPLMNISPQKYRYVNAVISLC